MSGSFSFLDEPTPADLVADALQRLEAGEKPADIESTRFDFKEDPSRRAANGTLTRGQAEHAPSARKLAAEVAAMANTPGGGALLIGVADKTGDFIGSALDAEWLQRRVSELLGGHVVLRVRNLRYLAEGSRTSTPLLVIEVDYASQPVSFNGKIQERQKEQKVTRSPEEAVKARYAMLHVDPSSMDTDVGLDVVSNQTIEALRMALRDFKPGQQLEQSPFADLVAALGLLSNRDQACLNQAGVLLLQDRPTPRLDYQHRPSPGSVSGTERVNRPNTSLLVELVEVLRATERHNTVTDIVVGNTRRSYGTLPQRSVREAVINGVAHRDWAGMKERPTVVEHIGSQLRVTSPGGLVDGITPENILTHSSKPRYMTLLTALRNLGLAEQQGIGIDTIHREMITIGAHPPQIEATESEVLVVLNGTHPDRARIEFFNLVLDPEGDGTPVEDVDFALIIDRLSNPVTPWATIASCAPVLQRSAADTEHSFGRLGRYVCFHDPILRPVKVPSASSPAWTLTKQARERLGTTQSPEQIEQAVSGWLEERGRISSSEYLALFNVSQPTATDRLKKLEAAGLLRSSTAAGRGHGFHYVAAQEAAGSVS